MIKKIGLAFVLTLFCQYSFGQTAIIGKWNVHCSMEQTNNKTITFCGLCFVNASDTVLNLDGFTMTIDTTHVQIGESKDRIPYIKRRNGKGITFVKDKRPYGFAVITTTSSDHVILRSSDGTMLLLQKIKEEKE